MNGRHYSGLAALAGLAVASLLAVEPMAREAPAPSRRKDRVRGVCTPPPQARPKSKSDSLERLLKKGRGR